MKYLLTWHYITDFGVFSLIKQKGVLTNLKTNYKKVSKIFNRHCHRLVYQQSIPSSSLTPGPIQRQSITLYSHPHHFLLSNSWK